MYPHPAPGDATMFGLACGLATDVSGKKMVVVAGGDNDGIATTATYLFDLEVISLRLYFWQCMTKFSNITKLSNI